MERAISPSCQKSSAGSVLIRVANQFFYYFIISCFWLAKLQFPVDYHFLHAALLFEMDLGNKRPALFIAALVRSLVYGSLWCPEVWRESRSNNFYWTPIFITKRRLLSARNSQMCSRDQKKNEYPISGAAISEDALYIIWFAVSKLDRFSI